MATSFPQPLAEHGLVLDEHLEVDDARAAAAAWLTENRQVPEATAGQVTAQAQVAADAWWSDELVTDGDGNQVPACFVMSPEFDGAKPVTIVALPAEYVAS